MMARKRKFIRHGGRAPIGQDARLKEIGDDCLGWPTAAGASRIGAIVP